jgi:hypothetical protein
MKDKELPLPKHIVAALSQLDDLLIAEYGSRLDDEGMGHTWFLTIVTPDGVVGANGGCQCDNCFGRGVGAMSRHRDDDNMLTADPAMVLQ